MPYALAGNKQTGRPVNRMRKSDLVACKKTDFLRTGNQRRV